jgi:hypothetical protein
MNTKQWMIVAGCFLALIVIISLTSTTVMPYSPNTLFSKEFVYEGLIPRISRKQMSGNVTKAKNTITNKVKPVVGRPGVGRPASKKETFENLLQASSSYNSPSPSIDFMSQLPSSGSCVSTYSNSMGYICLDKKAVNLLTTRGGNMSTGESQIG